MEVLGRIKPIKIMSFLVDSRDKVKPFIVKALEKGQKVKFVISGEAVITGTETGGVILLDVPQGETPGMDVRLETWYKRRTITQNNTLKGLESIIYQVDNGIAPPTSKDLWFIHEGIIERANLHILNPFTEKPVLISPSSPHCDTVAMNRFIEIALDELSMRDISEDVRSSIGGHTISDLFKTWYKERMIQEDINHIANWESYKQQFPWCEFTFRRGSSMDPLEQMHIVTKGSHPEMRDEPWNWIHGSQSIHRKQHQFGWGPILQDYPHMKAKVDKARALAGAREL